LANVAEELCFKVEQVGGGKRAKYVLPQLKGETELGDIAFEDVAE
jgi:hypothetical protein